MHLATQDAHLLNCKWKSRLTQIYECFHGSTLLCTFVWKKKQRWNAEAVSICRLNKSVDRRTEKWEARQTEKRTLFTKVSISNANETDKWKKDIAERNCRIKCFFKTEKINIVGEWFMSETGFRFIDFNPQL